MTVQRCLPVALLAAAALAGCGGDDSDSGSSGGDRGAVQAVFRTYLDSLAASDGAGACKVMAPSLQQKMLDAMKKAGAAKLVEGRSCGEVLDFIAENSPQYKTAAKSLKDAKITKLDINGDTAKYTWGLTVNGQAISNTGEASKSTGKWLITCCVPGQ